jgi:hypothetical protein
MKKLFATVLSLVLLAAVALGAAVWYIQPTKPLDLTYTKVAVADKIMEMIQRRSFDVRLTGADLNNLIKASVAARPQLPNGIRITGVEAAQNGDLLTADINALWRDNLPFTATLTYRISYAEPNLILHAESARIKRFELPRGWLEMPDLTFNLYDKLPKLVGIKTIQFEKDDVLISLKLR